MSIVGGLSAQVGFAEEVTPGTPVTVTRFIGPVSEDVDYQKERIESKGLFVGQTLDDKWVAGRESGSGPVNLEVMPNGFAILAKHMLGQIATTTPVGGTLARLHTAKIGPLDGKSLTMQVGRTPRTGTTKAYTYGGVKINAWELSMESNGVLMCKLDTDCTSESRGIALASASFPASNELLSFANVNNSIVLNGTTYDVDKWTCGGTNGLASERFKIGSPTKIEQLEGSERRQVTGTIDLESYVGDEPYDLFINGTEAALVSTFVGSLIEGSLRYMVKVTCPRVRVDGKTPTVGGAGLIPQAIPFKALHSSAGSTSCQIEVQNTDVAA